MEDKFIVQAPRTLVWEALIDPNVVGACIPGCASVETVSPTRYRATIRVEVGPIKAQFNLLVELKEQLEFEKIRTLTRGDEGSKASIITAESVVHLTAIEQAVTEIWYASDVTIAGRLGKFGFGIIQKKAKSLGQQFSQAFCDKVLARAALAQSA
jgi:carbon monoxide dehydrogenase subunit G